MPRKEPTTTQPGDFSNDLFERSLAEAREKADSVPVVSRAPKPPTPIRRPSSGMPPELIKLPRELPTDYPDTLRLRTSAVINEARSREKFPRRSQLLDFCKEVLANLTPDFYGEVQAARLQGPQALSHLDGLLDSLLLSNEYSEPILADLGQELKRSKERAAFIRELLRAEEQARRSPQASDEAEATEAPADNQDEQPVSPKDRPERNTWQKKLDDPKKYPWMTILETQEALGGISNSRVYALKDEGELQVLADIKPIRITTESVILLMEGKSDKIA